MRLSSAERARTAPWAAGHSGRLPVSRSRLGLPDRLEVGVDAGLCGGKALLRLVLASVVTQNEQLRSGPPWNAFQAPRS